MSWHEPGTRNNKLHRRILSSSSVAVGFYCTYGLCARYGDGDGVVELGIGTFESGQCADRQRFGPLLRQGILLDKIWYSLCYAMPVVVVVQSCNPTRAVLELVDAVLDDNLKMHWRLENSLDWASEVSEAG
ncbi:hypothetical protein FHL15_007266 [Xylaria flabelliformis]|uniref:Uncharacterized protein n=1 Tax=Xylaria flabelliformis TaxID=2512241 RepID=A0A553HVI4_9PEZI|nr:hypothetical protein FHL15_007266 [Xylaria flabelliformis]